MYILNQIDTKTCLTAIAIEFHLKIESYRKKIILIKYEISYFLMLLIFAYKKKEGK